MELKPCPFCGSEDVALIDEFNNYDYPELCADDGKVYICTSILEPVENDSATMVALHEVYPSTVVQI